MFSDISSLNVPELIQVFFDGKVSEQVATAEVPELEMINKENKENIVGVNRLNALGMDIIEIESNEKLDELYNELKNNPNVLSIEKDSDIKIFQSTYNDPFYKKLWGLDNANDKDINFNEMDSYIKSLGVKDEIIIVAVLDTGIALTHPDLKNQLWVNEKELYGQPGVDDDGNGYIDDIYGYDFVNNKGSPADDNFHGTHCSGTVSATTNNNEGILGVSSNTKIMTLKIMDRYGRGSFASAIKALNYAVSMKATVTSNSWGDTSPYVPIYNALQNAHKLIHICAAGNDGVNNDNKAQYPASYSLQLNNVVSVGAITMKGDKASYSNYGIKSVDLFAPGSDILSTCLNGTYCLSSGTSMATPHVTGVVSVLLAVAARLLINDGGSLSSKMPTPSELKSVIMSTVKKTNSLKNYTKTSGYINAFDSVKEMEKIIKAKINIEPSSDCIIGNWSAWSECPVKCGGGVRKRTRVITPMGDVSSVAKCNMNPTEQTEQCNTNQCSCIISEWNDWSSCSATCGINSIRKRTRTISGDQCSEITDETETCKNLPNCPIDCIVSAWTEWSQCSNKCGEGLKTRTRKLIEPQNGGMKCPLQSIETATCNNTPCECKIGEWSSWGNCSQPCGKGTRERTRMKNSYCSNDSKTIDTQVCELPSCLEKKSTCELSEWSTWSSCSTTCGTGISSRERIYISTTDGEECKQSPLIESNICNNDIVCREKSWIERWQSLITIPFKGLLQIKNTEDILDKVNEVDNFIELNNSVCDSTYIQLDVSKEECIKSCKSVQCSCFDIRNVSLTTSFGIIQKCRIGKKNSNKVILGVGSTAYTIKKTEI